MVPITISQDALNVLNPSSNLLSYFIYQKKQSIGIVLVILSPGTLFCIFTSTNGLQPSNAFSWLYSLLKQ